MIKSLRLVALSLLFLLAIAFSLKQLIEPDLWWQLRTGEWILETMSMPHADPFSFTYANTPWQNIKWGYEVLIALLSNTLGTEMLMLLQILCSCVLVYVLIKTTYRLSSSTPPSITYLLIGLSLVAIEYRITGRSEAISQVLFLVVCFVLLSFRNNPSRHIWWIPLIMMCWANLHEAFGIGLVVLFVFTFTSWFEALYTRTQSKEYALKHIQVLGASLAAMCVNPNHVHILLKPFEIANQVYQNKYTTELSTYTQSLFWTKEAWITLALFLFVFVVVVLRFFVSKSALQKWKRLNDCIPLPYAALLVVLVYVASTGHRNIVFATLAIVPVFIVNINLLLPLVKIKLSNTVTYVATIVLFALLYMSVVTNRYYTFWQSKNKYGLEIPAGATPIGAANFLQTNNLLQKPVFSDYLTSSYLLWQLQPTFKTFIDLRDLDIFPMEHFNLFTQIVSNPIAFEKADSEYHFASVVLINIPQMQTLHTHLYRHPSFRLAYVDAVCCVYVKDSALIPTHTNSNLSTAVPSKWAYAVSKVFNPWYSANDLSTIDQVYPASEYFYSVSDWGWAKSYAQASVKQGIESYRGLVMLGQVTYQQALDDTTQLRALKMDSAANYMQQALALNPDYVPALIDLGAFAFQRQQYKSAVNYFEKACDIDPDNLSAHTNTAEAYKTMAGTNNNKKYLEKAIEHFRKADYLNPHNPEIMMNLGFLYYRMNNCDKAVPYLEQIVDYQNLTDVQRVRAKEAIQKCN